MSLPRRNVIEQQMLVTDVAPNVQIIHALHLEVACFNPFNTTDRFTGLIMVIIRKGQKLLGVERVLIAVYFFTSV